MERVKEQLKKVGVTKQDLANILKLSRPTLDAYIDMYERGSMIPKKRYQIVFDRLFETELSGSEFEKALSSVNYLLERDKKYNIDDLDPDAADCLYDIYNEASCDLHKGGWNKDVYSFICYLIKHYRKRNGLLLLASYFCYMYVDRKKMDVEVDKVGYFVKFYDFFSALNKNDEHYSENDIKKLIDAKRAKIKALENKAKKNEMEITRQIK